MTNEEIDAAENLWFSMKRFAIYEDDQQRAVKAIFAAARKGVELEAKLPKTADGVPIFVGDDICRINTRDAGKTWYVTQHKVKGIEDCNGDPCCKVTPDDSKFPNGWYSTKGHNRFFNNEDAALKEAAALAAKGKA